MTAAPFAGIVLTGGASRRMGTDKAFVAIDGQPLAARVLAVLLAAGADPVLAIGGDLERLAELGYAAVADDHPGEGPLGGLLTGLGTLGLLAPADRPAFVTACDHPGLVPDLPAVLVDRWIAIATATATARPPDAVVPEVAGVRQPLAALYAGSALAPLTDAFGAGERSVRRASAALRTVVVTDLPTAWFVDVDTPGDLDHYAASDGSS